MSQKPFRRLAFFITVLSVVLIVGCGEKSDSSKPASSETTQQGAPEASSELVQPGVTATDPQTRADVIKTTEDFLRAIQSGQDNQVFAMMSPLARQVCDREKIPSLPASDAAQFTVDEVEMFAVDGVYVRTTMKEVDEQGNELEEVLVWALRKTEEGWRIAGVVFTLFTNFEPIVVNFESKEDIAAAEAQSLKQQQIYMAALQKAHAELELQNQANQNGQQIPPVGHTQTPAARQ